MVLRVRDVPLLVYQTAVVLGRRQQVSARRRRADYRRPGSLTWNRQQAARLYRQNRREAELL